jgi:hypothetical protein
MRSFSSARSSHLKSSLHDFVSDLANAWAVTRQLLKSLRFNPAPNSPLLLAILPLFHTYTVTAHLSFKLEASSPSP